MGGGRLGSGEFVLPDPTSQEQQQPLELAEHNVSASGPKEWQTRVERDSKPWPKDVNSSATVSSECSYQDTANPNGGGTLDPIALAIQAPPLIFSPQTRCPMHKAKKQIRRHTHDSCNFDIPHCRSKEQCVQKTFPDGICPG